MTDQSSPTSESYEFPVELLTLLISQGKYDEAHALIDRAAERIDWENGQKACAPGCRADAGAGLHKPECRT